MKEKWRRGHLGRFWDTESFKNFNYVRQPITKEETDAWEAKGYDYVKSFTGMMYDNRNPLPDWVQNFKSLFYTYKNMTFTFYKMSTLEIMPEHSDHYRTYIKLHDSKYENVHRILVMLEDWKPGHYLEIDGVGITNWIAGDYFIWKNDCKHAAANIGIEDRYTLQITCEEIEENDTWSKLHWYNIPDLTSKLTSSIDFMKRIRSFVPETKIDSPMFIYMFNETITELETIIHDGSTRNILNEKGLVFYLTEPLCSYIAGSPQWHPPKGTKHSMMFYSEFKGFERPQQFRADELDSIERYVIRNQLTNVKVYTCDYNAKKWYPYYSDFIEIDYDDLFVKSVLPKQIFDPIVEPNFTKKFICLNWRYTPHRQMLAGYVAPLSSYVSWYFRGEIAVIGKQHWIDIFNIQMRDPEVFGKLIGGIEYLNINSPMNVDLEITEPVVIMHSYFKHCMPNGTLYDHTKGETNIQKLEQAYRDVFCDIVTESRFAQPTGNYSEKTYQPMWFKKPFVLGAPPYTLKLLKEHGFKTFSDFWDESYDNVEIHEERLLKIFEVIDFINSKTIEELQDMYTQMEPILEHNYNLIKEKLPFIKAEKP
jgi:hypothetical protein